jgi:hypothetical protein
MRAHGQPTARVLAGDQLCNRCFYTAMRTQGICPNCGLEGWDAVEVNGSASTGKLLDDGWQIVCTCGVVEADHLEELAGRFDRGLGAPAVGQVESMSGSWDLQISDGGTGY